MSDFSFCPLVLQFCSKEAKNEITRAHKWVLRAFYGDYESMFEELVDKDKPKKIHKKEPTNTFD